MSQVAFFRAKAGQRRGKSRLKHFEIGKAFRYYIKQIDSMLPFVWFSNRAQKTSKCGKNISDTLGYTSCATFLFLPAETGEYPRLVYTKTVDSVKRARWLARQTPNILCYLPPSTSGKMAARFASVTCEEIIQINFLWCILSHCI